MNEDFDQTDPHLNLAFVHSNSTCEQPCDRTWEAGAVARRANLSARRRGL
jgi:hypothetical protein